LIAVDAFIAGAMAPEIGGDDSVGLFERRDVALPYLRGTGKSVDLVCGFRNPSKDTTPQI
jgi:hypothetical protein